MIDILLVLVFVAAVLTIAVTLIRSHESSGEQDTWVERAQRATSTAERRELIENAPTPDHVLDATDCWVKRGLSTEGLLYAESLIRRKQLGEVLDHADEDRIQKADAAWKHAKNLPTIRGRARLRS